MPWLKKKAPRKAPRRKFARGLRLSKPMRPSGKIHYFNECFSLGPTYVNAPAGTGFALGMKMTDLPQVANYSTLFTQYKILGVKLLIIPRATNTDSSTLQAGVVSGVANTRIAYAIQDSADYNPPASEIDVLACNGAKVRTGNRPFTVKYRPVPRLDQTDGTTLNTVGVGAKPQWINFDSHGADVLHYGVNMWVTTPANSVGAYPIAVNDIYAYISFACRDPR